MTFWANFRRNSGLDDPVWRSFVLRWCVVSLLVIGVACSFSYGYYQLDEQYQVLELVSYKLGKTPATGMAWEFNARMRPWLQPAIYYAAVRALMGLGMEDPFKMAFVCRAMSGLAALAAIAALMLAANALFGDDARRRPAVVLLALMWIVPYLAVRTSSESWSASFLSLGVAALVLGSSAEGERNRVFPGTTLLLAGLLLGLSFEFRYHVAFAVLGIIGWVYCFSGEDRRRTIGKLWLMFTGLALVFVVGSLVDSWGYHRWTLAPWQYFRQNILNGKASEFGVSPPWWYLLNLNFQPAAPVMLLWTVAMLATWIRWPRHLITWTTLPFFLAHCLVGHKEIRFLLPIAQLAVFFFILGYAPRSGGAPSKWFRYLWDRRYSWGAKAIWGVNLVALAVACLRSRQPNLEMQHYIYNQYPHGGAVYLLGPDTKDPYSDWTLQMGFYRPPDLSVTRLESFAALRSLVNGNPPSFLLVTGQLETAAELSQIIPAAKPIFGTYPAWVEHYNFFNWLSRARRFSIFLVEAQPQGPIVAERAATDRSTEPPGAAVVR